MFLFRKQVWHKDSQIADTTLTWNVVLFNLSKALYGNSQEIEAIRSSESVSME